MSYKRGFTLLEMVITIVIGSFIMLGITAYIKLGLIGYSSVANRQQTQSQAQYVIEKMTREIRHAVPNSFHKPADAHNCFEFSPIDYTGLYQTSGEDIEFIVGNEIDHETVHLKRWLVINPTRYEDLFPQVGQAPIQRFEVNLSEPHPNGVFKLKDAYKHFVGSLSTSGHYFVYRDDFKIRYCFDESTNQVTRNNTVIADSVNATESHIEYLGSSLERGGLVHIKLQFEQNDEISVYQQDVQVLNVP